MNSLLLPAADSHDASHIDFDTGGLSRYSFPKGFVFGTSTSAYQVEGMASKDGREPCLWDVFTKIPGFIVDNSSGEVAADQYNRYKQDVDIMAKLNFDAYRFSISWSRIFPNGVGEVNWKGVDYYHRLIDYLIHKGITPYACLFHQDLPYALEKKYQGWLNHQIVKDYADYADFCFKTFGGKVKHWFTFNEPRNTASLGYDTGLFPPGRSSKPYGNCIAGDLAIEPYILAYRTGMLTPVRCSATTGNSATEPYIVTHNLILSHATAVRIYRQNYQTTQKGKIGIILDFNWYEPLDTNSMVDQQAAQRARDFTIGWYLHPIVYGEYPASMQKIVGNRLPKFTDTEVKMVKGSMDFLGINQYTAYYATDLPVVIINYLPKSYQMDWHVDIVYKRNGNLIGQEANSKWLYITPWGMYNVVNYIKEHYGNPSMLITENGMDDPGNAPKDQLIMDTLRIQYYQNYMDNLKKAIDEGANVTGYFAWSLLDNFEWKAGYTARFGLVYVDFMNNLERYPKMSAYWFRALLTKKKPLKIPKSVGSLVIYDC